MMSTSTIRSMSEEAARRAKAKGKYPVEIFQSTIDAEQTKRVIRSMPMIGDWRPAGMELVQHDEIKVPPGIDLGSLWADAPYLMVDSSGFDDSSRALSLEQLVAIANLNPGCAWAMVEQGQFQVVVGVFRWTTPKRKH